MREACWLARRLGSTRASRRPRIHYVHVSSHRRNCHNVDLHSDVSVANALLEVRGHPPERTEVDRHLVAAGAEAVARARAGADDLAGLEAATSPGEPVG